MLVTFLVSVLPKKHGRIFDKTSLNTLRIANSATYNEAIKNSKMNKTKDE